RTTGVDAEFPTGLLQVFAHLVEQFGGERSGTHACGVGLDDADDAVDACGADARTHTGPAGGRVRGGHERVGAVVDVEHRRLTALHDDDIIAVEGLVV